MNDSTSYVPRMYGGDIANHHGKKRHTRLNRRVPATQANLLAHNARKEFETVRNNARQIEHDTWQLRGRLANNDLAGAGQSAQALREKIEKLQGVLNGLLDKVDALPRQR